MHLSMPQALLMLSNPDKVATTLCLLPDQKLGMRKKHERTFCSHEQDPCRCDGAGVYAPSCSVFVYFSTCLLCLIHVMFHPCYVFCFLNELTCFYFWSYLNPVYVHCVVLCKVTYPHIYCILIYSSLARGSYLV